MLLSPTTNDLAAFNAKLATLGESPRYWRINALESFYTGYQYVGRPSWWDAKVPLRDRAPSVQVQFARVAVNRLATLVFGDRSTPALTVSTSAFKATLTDDERDAAQALVDDIAKAITLSHTMRQYLVEGLKSSSVCAVLSLCCGKPRVELLPTKRCTPTFAADGSCASLVVEYKHPSREDPKAWLWYRREISAAEDRVFSPVPVIDGKPPTWGASEATPQEFCPVVWTRNLKPATAGDDIDGCALIEGLEDEIEALDRELSQLDRNSLYNGEPQTVRIGVDAQMGAPGTTAGAQPKGEGFSWFNSILPGFMRGGGGEATTQKAPGKLWDIPTGGDAKLLESSGAGANILLGAITEMRRVLCDASGVVLVDPKTLGSGELSARALTLMHAPMLDVADSLRVEYGAALVAIINGFLRLCSGAAAARDGVLLASWEAARPALAKFSAVVMVAGATLDAPKVAVPRWLGADLALAWGPYFEPSIAERAQSVDLAQKAVGGAPVLTMRQAVTSLASLFGIGDVDATLEDLAEGAEHERGEVTKTLAGLNNSDEEEPTDAPEVTIDAPPADSAPTADVQATALNSAQVTSLGEIVVNVATGVYPRETGALLVSMAFPVSIEDARALMATLPDPKPVPVAAAAAA